MFSAGIGTASNWTAMALALVAFAIGAPPTQAQSAAERREALAQISEKLNDPDPFMRLAHMEEIVASGRAADTQIAVKMALSSSDPELRSMGLRAYMSSISELRLEMSLPPEVDKAVKDAKGDERTEQKVRRANRGVFSYYNGLSQRLNIGIEDAEFASGRFQVFTKSNLTRRDDRYAGSGSVTGDRVVFDTRVRIGSQIRTCSVELGLAEGLSLAGEMSCQSSSPIPLSTRIY
jgi:hypothetical protein